MPSTGCKLTVGFALAASQEAIERPVQVLGKESCVRQSSLPAPVLSSPTPRAPCPMRHWMRKMSSTSKNGRRSAIGFIRCEDLDFASGEGFHDVISSQRSLGLLFGCSSKLTRNLKYGPSTGRWQSPGMLQSGICFCLC